MSPPFDLIEPLLEGSLVTMGIAVVSGVLALGFAFMAGLARLSRIALVRYIATIYVEVFRGTSLIVQLFWIFYVLPFLGVRAGAFEAGVVTLGLHFGAYGSEIVRSSILAVGRAQRDAATALNMTPAATMRRIILPQALMTMLPPFANTAIELLKGTSIMSLIAVTELAFAGRILILENTGRMAIVYGLVLALYFLMAFPLSRMVRTIERRVSYVGDRAR